MNNKRTKMRNKKQAGEKTSNFLLEKKVGKENKQIKAGINLKIFSLGIIGIMLIVIGMKGVSAVTNAWNCSSAQNYSVIFFRALDLNTYINYKFICIN